MTASAYLFVCVYICDTRDNYYAHWVLHVQQAPIKSAAMLGTKKKKGKSRRRRNSYTTV